MKQKKKENEAYLFSVQFADQQMTLKLFSAIKYLATRRTAGRYGNVDADKYAAHNDQRDDKTKLATWTLIFVFAPGRVLAKNRQNSADTDSGQLARNATDSGWLRSRLACTIFVYEPN